MEPDSLLLEGILALERGERKRAGALLVRYTRSNPKSAEGWLWLSRCLDDPKEVAYCLGKAREIDPDLVSSFNFNSTSPLLSAARQAPKSPGRARLWLARLPKLNRRILWGGAGLLVVLAAVAGWLLYRERQKQLNLINPYIAEARQVIANCGAACDYAAGVDKLDQVLKLDPSRADARYLRALALVNLAEARLSQPQALNELARAREDIDRCIAISPGNGRDYVLRARIYRALALHQEMRVDAEKLLRAGLENLLVAQQLGDKNPEQFDRPWFFVQLDLCDEGRGALAELFAELPPDQDSAILEEWEALARLSCEGDFAGSLEALDRSLRIDADPLRAGDSRSLQRALLLYYMKQPNAALVELDGLIDAQPDGGGERYFLRGLILYQQGEYALAKEDLVLGEANTAQRGGLDAYVRFLLALDAGDDAAALGYIQQAEASTLYGIYTPMLEQYRAELDLLGASPLEPTPLAEFQSTPISVEQ